MAWTLPVRLMRVQGPSMRPTLAHDDIIVVEPRAYRRRRPESGHIVVAEPSKWGTRPVIKRIGSQETEDLFAEEAAFFLVGDSTQSSTDSRALGTVSKQEIIGRVRLRLWPSVGRIG